MTGRPAGSKSGHVHGHSAVRYPDRSVLIPHDADGKPYPYDALPIAGSARCSCGQQWPCDDAP